MTLLFAQIFQTTSLFPETKLIWTPKMEFHERYIYIYIMICLINSKIPKIELYKHEK